MNTVAAQPSRCSKLKPPPSNHAVAKRLSAAVAKAKTQLEHSGLHSFRHCPNAEKSPRSASAYQIRLLELETALLRKPAPHCADAHAHELLLSLASLAHPPKDFPAPLQQHLSKTVTTFLAMLR